MIVELLLGLGFALTIGFGVIVAQIVVLARILRSRAWLLLALAFITLYLRIIWAFIKQPATMIRAIGAGSMPESIPLESWIMIAALFLTVGLFIAAFDQQRRDLRHIGV